MTSQRHEYLRLIYPSEPAPWQKPVVERAERPAFGGCSCWRGMENCTCSPDTQPAVHIYDSTGRQQLRWMQVVLALVVVGICGALIYGAMQ